MALGSDDSNQNTSPGPQGKLTLKVFSEVIPAESAASLLKANGISCWLQADDCGGMLSALDSAQGVKLLVNPTDAEPARALLAAMPDAAAFEAMVNSGPASGVTPLPKSEVPIVSILQIGGGTVAGILLCLLYQWASQLGVKTYRYDTDGDGKKDSVWFYRNGECVEIDEDRNFDGVLDSWASYTNGFRCVSAKADNNFDGTPDAWWYYTNGILTSALLDTDFNGIPDVKSYFKYGQVIQSDWQPNGTNIVTVRDVFHHEVLTEKFRDTNSDGLFDLRIRYDAFLNPIATNAIR
jgi:hypothetical protein